MGLVRFVVGVLDRVSALLPKVAEPAHLKVGREGEEAAYWWLRAQGYTIVARNWRSPRAKGELDLVGWDEGELCFIEVKTRSSRGVVPAEMSVTRDKQHELIGMARLFMRRMPKEIVSRFDVVSVYLDAGKDPVLELRKGAFERR